MTTKIYTVLDIDAGELDRHVLTAPNDTVAMRIMKNSLNQDKLLKMNADRYDLICLGELEGGKKVCNLDEIRKTMEPTSEQ